MCCCVCLKYIFSFSAHRGKCGKRERDPPCFVFVSSTERLPHVYSAAGRAIFKSGTRLLALFFYFCVCCVQQLIYIYLFIHKFIRIEKWNLLIKRKDRTRRVYSRGCKFVYLVLKYPPFYCVLADIWAQGIQTCSRDCIYMCIIKRTARSRRSVGRSLYGRNYL